MRDAAQLLICYIRGVRKLVVALGLAVSLASAVPAAADPPTTHEIIYTRPSGFWTSNRPAVGGAYKWRLMLIGVGVCAITAFFVVRAIKRANADRLRNSKPG